MEDRRFCTELQPAFPDFNLLLILPEYNLYTLRLFHNILTFPPFQRKYYQYLFRDFLLLFNFET